MSRTMCLCSKREKKLDCAAASVRNFSYGVAAEIKKCRLFVYDKTTNCNFLIDSGSDISCIPAPVNCKYNVPDNFSYAANDSKIPTYSRKILDVDLGLRRRFQWSFVIAQVNIRLLVWILWNIYGILIDLKIIFN